MKNSHRALAIFIALIFTLFVLHSSFLLHYQSKTGHVVILRVRSAPRRLLLSVTSNTLDTSKLRGDEVKETDPEVDTASLKVAPPSVPNPSQNK